MASRKAAMKPGSRGQESRADDRHERMEYQAAGIENAGRRAMEQRIPPRPTRVISERRMPKFCEAPKGARVIASSRGCVALALHGFYLGLFALDEV